MRGVTRWIAALALPLLVGCSSQEQCEPTFVGVLPLSLSSDPLQLASGDCTAACLALAPAANAQEAVLAAANCSFVSGTATTLDGDGDGGPALFCSAPALELFVGSPPSVCVVYGAEGFCTTIAVPVTPSNGDGGNCQDSCFAAVRDAGDFYAEPTVDAGLPLEPDDFTCAVQPGYTLVFSASVIDGGPGVICFNQTIPLSSATLPSLDAGCPGICLAILGDGGFGDVDGVFPNGTVPTDPPSSCDFEPLPDGGPGVLCDWEAPCPSYSNTGGGCGALLTPQPNVFLVILGVALGGGRRRRKARRSRCLRLH